VRSAIARLGAVDFIECFQEILGKRNISFDRFWTHALHYAQSWLQLHHHFVDISGNPSGNGARYHIRVTRIVVLQREQS
jgi:hypothetical protein